MVVSLSKESESGSWLRPDLLYLLKRLPTVRECSVLCCEEEFLPKHYAEAGRTSLFKAISVLQLSPAVLKEFRMSLARRKKKAAVPAGSRSTAPGGGAGAPNEHQDSLPASAKPTSCQARAIHPSSQIGFQRLAKGPRLCRRVHRQSRAY